MALERQVELAMDAMQASHDALMGHMANVQASVLGLPVAAPSDEPPKPGELRGRPEPKDYPDEPMPKPIKPTGEGIYSDVGGVRTAQDSSLVGDKEQWFATHPPPGGDKNWQALSDKERQDLMWDTGVIKHLDPEYNHDEPEKNIKNIQEDIDRWGRLRGNSDIKGFRDYEDSIPEGVDFYHLDDGTTIIHKPTESTGAKISLSDAPAEGESGQPGVKYSIGPQAGGHQTPVLDLNQALKTNKALRDILNTDTFIHGSKSEQDLIMKLAGEIVGMPGAGYPWQVRRSPEDVAKLKTKETLDRVLGGGTGAKVLPISPDDKRSEADQSTKIAANIAVPDSVYGALSSYAQSGNTADAHKAMPSGWKANFKPKNGVEVVAPDGRVHFIPNGDF